MYLPIRVAVVDNATTLYSELTQFEVDVPAEGVTQFLFTKDNVAIPGGAGKQSKVFIGFDEGPWPNMTAGERSNILLKAADLISERLDEIAYLDAIEAGKPISQCKGEIGGAADIWRYAAALARTLYGESYNNLGDGTMGVVLREPIGVVSVIQRPSSSSTVGSWAPPSRRGSFHEYIQTPSGRRT